MQVISGKDAKAYGRHKITVHDTWGDFVTYCEGPVASHSEDYRASRTTPRRRDWDMNLGYEKSIDLARQGWSEMRSEIEAMANEVSSRIGNVEVDTFVPTFDVCGVAVDVGRMMSGEYECMIQPELRKVPRDTSVVTIVIDMFTSASVSAQTYLKRGAAVLALLEIIRQMGVPAEVWLTLDMASETIPDNEKETGFGMHAIPLVKSDQPIDIDALAFGLAHPATFRRLGFSAHEVDDSPKSHCYGLPMRRPGPWTMEHLRPTVALNGVGTSVGEAGDCVNDPVNWIVAQLEGAGLTENSSYTE